MVVGSNRPATTRLSRQVRNHRINKTKKKECQTQNAQWEESRVIMITNRISVTCRRQGVSQRAADNNNNNTASCSMQQCAAQGGDKAPRQSHARALAISRYMHRWWRSRHRSCSALPNRRILLIPSSCVLSRRRSAQAGACAR